MWKLADEVLDTFLDGGRGEFIKASRARSPCW